jgi:hypothetical protein
LDVLGVFLHVLESAEEALAKVGGCLEEPVVGGFPARVMPDPLLRVEFRGVFGQGEDLDARALLLKPSPNLRMSMIGGVILDEINSMASSIIGWQKDVLDKSLIGQMVEILGLMPVSELGPLQTDGAENLLGVAFAPSGYFWSTVLRSPGLMQGWALAKRGFVHIDDYGLLGLGVFFRLG